MSLIAVILSMKPDILYTGIAIIALQEFGP